MCLGSDPKGYAVACVHPPLPLKPNRSCSQYTFLGEGGGGGGGGGGGAFSVDTVSNAISGLSF